MKGPRQRARPRPTARPGQAATGHRRRRRLDADDEPTTRPRRRPSRRRDRTPAGPASARGGRRVVAMSLWPAAPFLGRRRLSRKKGNGLARRPSKGRGRHRSRPRQLLMPPRPEPRSTASASSDRGSTTPRSRTRGRLGGGFAGVRSIRGWTPDGLSGRRRGPRARAASPDRPDSFRYRLTLTDGSEAAGLGDVYLNAKIGLIDPAQPRAVSASQSSRWSRSSTTPIPSAAEDSILRSQ